MPTRTNPSTQQRTGAQPTGSTMTTTTMWDATVLRDCANVCYETFNYCIQQGGDHIEEDHVRCLIDCAELCTTTANFIARDSDVADELLEACATACKNCEATCQNFEDDTVMKTCEDACREAYEFCNR